MKFIISMMLLGLLVGCSGAPEMPSGDNREAAERAKDRAEEAYRDLDKNL